MREGDGDDMEDQGDMTTERERGNKMGRVREESYNG